MRQQLRLLFDLASRTKYIEAMVDRPPLEGTQFSDQDGRLMECVEEPTLESPIGLFRYVDTEIYPVLLPLHLLPFGRLKPGIIG
jgi:hypothetical protein